MHAFQILPRAGSVGEDCPDVDDHDAVAVLATHAVCRGERESRLPHASRTDEHDETIALDAVADMVQVGCTTDDRRRTTPRAQPLRTPLPRWSVRHVLPVWSRP